MQIPEHLKDKETKILSEYRNAKRFIGKCRIEKVYLCLTQNDAGFRSGRVVNYFNNNGYCVAMGWNGQSLPFDEWYKKCYLEAEISKHEKRAKKLLGERVFNIHWEKQDWGVRRGLAPRFKVDGYNVYRKDDVSFHPAVASFLDKHGYCVAVEYYNEGWWQLPVRYVKQV